MLKKIKKLFSKKKEKISDNFEIFLGLVEVYLKREHPKINFDFSIVESLKKEENLKIKKSLFIDEIAKQFCDFEYIKKSQKSVDKKMLWSGYGANCAPSPKQPYDFLRRKELVFLRDEAKCDRCGNKIEKINQAFTVFIEAIEDGGAYNLENLAIVCFNCYQVLNKQEKNLQLIDDLYSLV